MAIDFPASPTNGQVYQGYYYDGDKGAWRSQNTTHGSVITSATTPTGATAGDMWFNTTDGTLFIYYNDGISTNWVEVNSTSSLLGQEFDTRLDSLEATRTSILAGTTKIPGSVVQVVESRYLPQAVTTSTSYSQFASFSITPKFSNSKIIVQGIFSVSAKGSIQITRPGATIFDPTVNYHIYDAQGTGWQGGTQRVTYTVSASDSPATTSAVTYSFNYRAYDTNGFGINEGSNGSNGVSHVILIEVAQ